MFFKKDVSSRNGDNDFQNAIVGVDLRQTQKSDSGVSPSDRGWLTEGSDLSREYSTGTSPGFQEGTKSGTPSPKSPSHQLHSVKPQSARQRTSQACDKCRERKTKCSGHRPVCLRCTNRGLICEYTMRESRSRTPASARSRVAIVSETTQADYTGQGRPTPAHHSRIGGGRTNAFAPPTRSYTGTPNAPRPSIPNPSANGTTGSTARNIPVQQNHRSQQLRQLSDISTESNTYRTHVAATSPNPSYSAGGGWPMHDSSLALNYSFGLPSCDNDLLQPSPSSNTHDERQTMHSALTSISLPQSSLRFDYDLSSLLLPSTPASHRQHDLDARPAQAYPCCINEDASYYIPPYTQNIDSTYFHGGFPDPIYHANNSNSSTSTLSTTPMGSRLELACPTPSIPVDPAAFRDVGGTFSGNFEFNSPSEFRYASPPFADGRTDYFGY